MKPSHTDGSNPGAMAQQSLPTLTVTTFDPIQSAMLNSSFHSYEDAVTVSLTNYSWPVLLLVPVILCSVIGNLLVCLAISRDRKLQNLTNFFLFSMAMADLMVALLVMPFGLAKDLLGYWPMGPVMCNIWTTMDVFCCTSSILHMCTISIDRYVAISDPLRHKRQPRTRCGIIIKICTVWACAAGLSSPLCIIGFLQPSTVINNRVCAVTNIHFMIYGSVVAFFIPLCIVVVTYSLTTYSLYKKTKICKETENQETSRLTRKKSYPQIILHMVKQNGFERVSIREERYNSAVSESLQPQEYHPSQLSLSSEEKINGLRSLRRTTSRRGSQSIKRLNTEKRASKVLGLVFTAFVVGWTPFFVANVIGALCPDCVNNATVFSICTWIGWASSMVNPFIYTAFNVRFRQAFVGLLTCSKYYPLLKRSPTPSSPRERRERYTSIQPRFITLNGNVNGHGHSDNLCVLKEVSE